MLDILFCRENISYASTCNFAGLCFGTFFGYILPITLTSESFCNKWLRFSPQSGGLIELQGEFVFLLRISGYIYPNKTLMKITLQSPAKMLNIFYTTMISGYLYFWGVVFIVVTTFVAIFKVEKDCVIPGPNAVDFSVYQTYKLLYKLIQLSDVRKLVIVLFTVQVRTTKQ